MAIISEALSHCLYSLFTICLLINVLNGIQLRFDLICETVINHLTENAASSYGVRYVLFQHFVMYVVK